MPVAPEDAGAGPRGNADRGHYGTPYDIEFGIDDDMAFPENAIILQIRSESVWSKKAVTARTEMTKDPMERILGRLLTVVKLM